MRRIASRSLEAATMFASASGEVAPFTADQIALSPADPGVYFLYRQERVIYIGSAVQGTGIRQELERHLQGDYGVGTKAATAFDYEITRDAVVASQEYIRVHMERHGGRKPACNERD